MSSITIHGIENTVDILIREKAKKEGKSLNKTIQSLLKKSLGLEAVNENDRKNNFTDLFGVWDKNDEKEFVNNTKMFDKIDNEDWK
jgi:mRNA-degrading endonuclease RelE of RelBE toxin-antitoxin system